MPLVVPGITSSSGGKGDKSAEWSTKLMGKKLGEASDANTFAKKELPQEHRVLGPGSMATLDFKPERMNVHVGEDGTVNKITHG